MPPFFKIAVDNCSAAICCETYPEQDSDRQENYNEKNDANQHNNL
jgi:hypothetical protein